MRILLQNCKTGQFLTTSGTWTEDFHEARRFTTSAEAVSFCVRGGGDDLQVVLKFSRDDLDVKLPLSDACKEEALRP